MQEAAQLYQQVIMDRSRNPRHAVRLQCADASAREDNPMCGDHVTVDLCFAPDGSITDAGFEARGCAISLASADLMAELAPGRDASGLRAVFARFESMLQTGECDTHDSDMDRLRPLIGVHDYPSRIGCATLPWRALIAALPGKEV